MFSVNTVGCKTRSSLIQNCSRFSRWKSLHREQCSMMRIFILLKSTRLWSDSLECLLTGRNVLLVSWLLCPFRRLWKGCLDSPTYRRPQTKHIYAYILTLWVYNMKQGNHGNEQFHFISAKYKQNIDNIIYIQWRRIWNNNKYKKHTCHRAVVALIVW